MKTTASDLEEQNPNPTMGKDVEIIEFEPQYSRDFEQLNRAWIEKYFRLEPRDLQVLSNPETEIIQPGGVILLARCQGKIIGTCALIKLDDNSFELAKMTVTETIRGKKVGHKLIMAAIEKVRAFNAKTLELATNDQLHAAIHLYEKFGFRHVPVHPRLKHYDRVNVMMTLNLV